MKTKICKNTDCKKEFTPMYSSWEKYCSYECIKSCSKPDIRLKTVYKIPKVSKKRKVEQLQYQVLRTEFLSKPENKICPITKRPTTDVHHKFSGKDRAKYFLDVSTWLAVSREGHNWIHNNPKKSRELGFLN